MSVFLDKSESPEWAVGSMQETLPLHKIRQTLAPQPTSLTPASRSLHNKKIHGEGEEGGEDPQRGQAFEEMPNRLTYGAKGKPRSSTANHRRVSGKR